MFCLFNFLPSCHSKIEGGFHRVVPLLFLSFLLILLYVVAVSAVVAISFVIAAAVSVAVVLLVFFYYCSGCRCCFGAEFALPFKETLKAVLRNGKAS